MPNSARRLSICPMIRPPLSVASSSQKIARTLAGEESIEIIGGAHPHRRSGLKRCTAQMRQEKDIFDLTISRVYIGFTPEHIETGRRELARFEGVEERIVIDDVAARRIDQDCAIREKRQSIGIYEIAGLGRRSAIDGQIITERQHVRETGMITGAMRKGRIGFTA